ncbi:MAG: hypothetical protein AAFN40_27810, partial [Cyanobacteria bacterium J06560_6]
SVFQPSKNTLKKTTQSNSPDEKSRQFIRSVLVRESVDLCYARVTAGVTAERSPAAFACFYYTGREATL